jgi:hypothetical protein
VVRVAAGANPAEMVKVETFGDGADVELVHPAMHDVMNGLAGG